MSTIVTRAGKGSPLTSTEVDSNFTNLNTDKVEKSGSTMTGDLAFGDNVKAKFGDLPDLQIYHTGTESFIDETGTGGLYIRSNYAELRSPANEPFIQCQGNGAVSLYYDNSKKLATTSSGVDITGDLVADGATFEGNVTLTKSVGDTILYLESDSDNNNESDNAFIIFKADGGFENSAIWNGNKGGTNDNTLNISNATGVNGGVRFFTSSTDNGWESAPERLKINVNGDISFYEDTGTTAKLTWDASDESLNLKDNVDLLIGDSGDLRLFHNGTNSFVYGQGAGDLHLRGNNNVILSTNTGESMLTASVNGAVTLYYDNSAKLATTSTGIDVTGTITADDSVLIEGGVAQLILNETDVSQGNSALINSGGQFSIRYRSDDGNTTTRRLAIDNNGGDISFYNDAGTSQDFYWDASTSRLGIGTTSPTQTLDVSGTARFNSLNVDGSSNRYIYITSSDGLGECELRLGDVSDTDAGSIAYDNATNSMQFRANAAERMRIDSSGRVGIGTTSPSYNLDVVNTSTFSAIRSRSTVGNGVFYLQGPSRQWGIFGGSTDGGTLFIKDETANAERVVIDTSGNVGIGTTSPSNALHVYHATTNHVAMFESGDFTSEISIKDNTASSYITNEAGKLKLRADVNGEGASSRIQFDVDGSEAARIDSSGNLLVGTTSTSSVTNQNVIQVSAYQYPTLRIKSTGASTNVQGDIIANESSQAFNIATATNHPMVFFTNNAEAARFDTSGNLLVGTTDGTLYNNTSGEGVGLINGNHIEVARSGGAPIFLNRMTSDGNIAGFFKNGGSIGNIGVDNTDNIFLSGNSTHSGLMVGTESIVPYSNGATTDATEDLGASSIRWRDLYLSGGVYFGDEIKGDDFYHTDVSGTIENADGTVTLATVAFGNYAYRHAIIEVQAVIKSSSGGTRRELLKKTLYQDGGNVIRESTLDTVDGSNMTVGITPSGASVLLTLATSLSISENYWFNIFIRGRDMGSLTTLS